MDQQKVCRMSLLFEKMVSESANSKEQCELKSLYEEFIEDGRNSRTPLTKSGRKNTNEGRITH